MSKEPVYRVGFKVATMEEAVQAGADLGVPVEAACSLGTAFAVVVTGDAFQAHQFAAGALAQGRELVVMGRAGNDFCKPGETRILSPPHGAGDDALKGLSDDEVAAFYAGMAAAMLFMFVYTSNVGHVQAGVASKGDGG